MARRLAAVWVLVLVLSASAGAQTSGSSATSTAQSPTTSQTPSSSATPPPDTRPAPTTFFGDSGRWYVPTGEVLAHGKWSVSGYRRGSNWIQGYTNVADFAGTVGVGLGGRAELSGSFLFDTRIDRDVRPLFLVDNSTFGGIVDRYPRVTQLTPASFFPVGALTSPRTANAAGFCRYSDHRFTFAPRYRSPTLVGSACGHTEPRTCESSARCQRQFALGVGPQRQWKKVVQHRESRFRARRDYRQGGGMVNLQR